MLISDFISVNVPALDAADTTVHIDVLSPGRFTCPESFFQLQAHNCTSGISTQSAASATSVAGSSPTTSSHSNGSGHPLRPGLPTGGNGLSVGGKIGIGVSVGVSILVFLACLLFVFARRYRRIPSDTTTPLGPCEGHKDEVKHELEEQQQHRYELVSQLPHHELEGDSQRHELEHQHHPLEINEQQRQQYELE